MNSNSMPCNLQAEKSVLGIILMHEEAAILVMSRLFKELFYKEEHQLIFETIKILYDQHSKIDLVTLWNQILKQGWEEKVGTIFELTKLTNEVVGSAGLTDHVNILCEQFVKREIITQSFKASDLGYKNETDSFDLLLNTGKAIDAIYDRINSGVSKDISYYAKEVIEQHNAAKNNGVIGIKTGIQEIDSNISGLVAPDLIIIAARPGQGKTALALSITHNTSILQDIPCAWFSLEMDGSQLIRRLSSINSGIDHELIRNGKTSENQEKDFHKSVSAISTKKIFIEDRASLNIRDIRTRASILKRRYGIQYIVVDYIQLMEGIDVKNKIREQIVSEISRGLKTLAKELNLPIIALSQLSREVEKRGDKLPQLSDLRESGAIEQDADIVLFLMRPEYYEMEEPIEIRGNSYDVEGLCIVNRAKNRHGGTGNSPIHFTGSTMKFSNL